MIVAYFRKVIFFVVSFSLVAGVAEGGVQWERNIQLKKKAWMADKHYINHHLRKYDYCPPEPECDPCMEQEMPISTSCIAQDGTVIETISEPLSACAPTPCCPNMDCPCEEICELDTSELDEDGSYRLKIGDRFVLSIYGELGSTREVFVDPTGSISFALVNSLYVLGKTVDQVRKELTERIQKEIRFVLVAITPQVFIGEQYSVLGEVRAPGTKLLRPGMTLLEAISETGGLNYGPFRGKIIEYADLKHAFLARRGEYVPVDFCKLIRCGDTSQNIRLQNGDYIFIPSVSAQNIYVLGAVGAPGIFEVINCATLTEVISYSGGLLEQASSRVAILRGSLCNPIKYLVDFNRIMKGCECDIVLEPGDIVFVPVRKFSTIEEIFKGAIRTAMYTVARRAGENAFLSVYPSGTISDSDFFLFGGDVGTTIVEP